MRIGVIADTHDNLDAVNYLTEALETRGASRIIHAGDFIAPFVIPALAEFDGPVNGVFGNNDGDREALLQQAENTAVEIEEPPLTLELGGRKIAVSHTPEQLSDSVSFSSADVAVNGHTHRPGVKNVNDCLRVNPGEAGGWLTGATHYALLDLAELEVELEVVPAP